MIQILSDTIKDAEKMSNITYECFHKQLKALKNFNRTIEMINNFLDNRMEKIREKNFKIYNKETS